MPGHTPADLEGLHKGIARGQDRLKDRYTSSHAPVAWTLLLGLGPLTRAEIARALDVTARTASQVALALEQAKLIAAPVSERPLHPVLPQR